MTAHTVTPVVILEILVFILAPIFALRPAAKKADSLFKNGGRFLGLGLLVAYIVVSSLFQVILYLFALKWTIVSWYDWLPILVAVSTLRIIEMKSVGAIKAFSTL